MADIQEDVLAALPSKPLHQLLRLHRIHVRGIEVPIPLAMYMQLNNMHNYVYLQSYLQSVSRMRYASPCEVEHYGSHLKDGYQR